MKKIISFILILAATLAIYTFFAFTKENKSVKVADTAEGVQQKKEFRILAVGDSLTAGYGLNISESYPAQLERKLLDNGYDVEVINTGISGETTAGLLERVDFLKKQNPKAILITIGGNDALRALPNKETEKNMRNIISSFKEILPSKNIFLMNVQAPANLGSLYTKEFNQIYKKMSLETGINLIPFVTTEIFTNPSLMQNDGIHPNSVGYKQIVDQYIYNKVSEVLEKSFPAR